MKECFSQINSAETIRTLLLDSELNSEEPAAVRQRLEAGFRAELIKQNPKRKVFRLICPDNSEMYLKLFARQRFPFSLFRFYAAKEYRAAHTLEKMGLPMIHYLAWGHLCKGGFCLSEGVRDVRPARRYFFETLRHNPRQQRDFLNALASLTLSLCRNNVYHPDFHLGNILYSSEEKKIYLADPWGIRENLFSASRIQVRLCLPWLELRGSISEDDLLNGILSSGLAKSKMAALELLQRAEKRYIRRKQRQRKKLTARILSGKSKYATELQLPEGACAFRHTLWFTPPEKLELNPAWRKQEYDSAEASVNEWVDSFLLLPPPENPPLARLVRPDGHSVLFFAE